MKIVQIFPGKVWGGAEQYVLDLGQALAARGHEVIFMARNDGKVAARLEKSGISFRPFNFSWARSCKAADAVSAEIKDADVVHVHDVAFAPLAVRARRRSGSKAKIVMTRHDAHSTPVNPLYRSFVKQVDRVIFVSDIARRAWLGGNKWFPTDKCRVVINSVPEPAGIPTESLRDKYNIPASTPLLLFCGRIKKTKGCHVLIEALGKIKDRDFALVMIGAAPKESYIRKLGMLADQAGITERIHYYGFSPVGRDFLPQADIALAPSSGKEACPLTNLEAMQAGICTVASTSGGQVEYIDNGRTGLLVPPGDVDALAEATASLIDNPDKRIRIAAAGRQEFVTNMSYDKFVNRIIEAYQ